MQMQEKGVHVYDATVAVGLVLKRNSLMLRGIARFADVGLQYLGVAEDNQTGKIIINDIFARVGHH